MRITKTFVDQVVPPSIPEGASQAQQFYRDTAIPGFALRVMNTGVKSFIVEKRIGGKVRRITLGRYGNLTVEQARKEAMQLLGVVASGKDPIAEKRDTRLQAFSLQSTFDDYLLTRKNLRESTIKDYKRCMTWAFGDWLSKPVASITKDMVEARHRKQGLRSEARANNAMRVLRALFNHARHKFEDSHGKPLILFNPVERISQTRGWYKVEARQTLLKAHQLQPWFAATQQLNATTTRDYLPFLLFTGLRRSEASRLDWSQVDFKARTFTIPDTKNGLTHTLPFSTFLEDLLLRRYEERQSPYVFHSNSDRGYLTEPKTAMMRVTDISGITFKLHDLRRTFITIAEGLNIAGYALKKLLNHKDPNDVTAGYIISDVERLRMPMQLITNYMLRQINSDPPQQELADAVDPPHFRLAVR